MNRSIRVLIAALGLLVANLMTGNAQHDQCVESCKSQGLTESELGECIADCSRTNPPGLSIPCGAAACDAQTEFCCNESCSICAPIGGSCIQIPCGPAE